MAATYHISSQAIAFASGKDMLNVFQTSSGTVTVKVYRIFMFNNQTAGVTGILTTMQIRRLTAASAGSAVTILKHNTGDATLTNVTGGTGQTVTASDIFRRILWSNDEPTVSTGTIDEFEMLVPNAEIWNSGYGDSNVEPLVCRSGQNEGIDLHQSGASAVGTTDAEIEMTAA